MKSYRLLLAAVAASLPLLAAAQDKKAGGPAPAGRCSGIDVHRLPFDSRLPGLVPAGLSRAQDRRPVAAVHLESALKDYRQGDRAHPTMTGIAKGLTDQQISAVAAYYAARGK